MYNRHFYIVIFFLCVTIQRYKSKKVKSYNGLISAEQKITPTLRRTDVIVTTRTIIFISSYSRQGSSSSGIIGEVSSHLCRGLLLQLYYIHHKSDTHTRLFTSRRKYTNCCYRGSDTRQSCNCSPCSRLTRARAMTNAAVILRTSFFTSLFCVFPSI